MWQGRSRPCNAPRAVVRSATRLGLPRALRCGLGRGGNLMRTSWPTAGQNAARDLAVILHVG
eukprot:11222169-Lingulodinium_polyedra.AAC.1